MSILLVPAIPLLILFGLWLLARRAMLRGFGTKEAEQYAAWEAATAALASRPFLS